MKDLKSSVQAGIKAAKLASKNAAEINEVIAGVAKQVEEVSENKATLKLTSFTMPPKRKVFETIINSYIEPGQNYQALAICDKDGRNAVEIAKWSVTALAYPCGIFFGNQKMYCSTKEELEDALSELLKDVNTGKAILAKMQ